MNASLRDITALAVEPGEALGDVIGPLAEERGEGVEARVALVEGAENAIVDGRGVYNLAYYGYRINFLFHPLRIST